MGGAQPVARVPFYVLDEDLESILRKAGKNSDLIFEYGTAVRYSQPNQLRWMRATIEPHIIQTVTTDFDGSGRFDNLHAGTYYVVGVAETRGGFAVWNLKVEVGRSTDTIILDQNNAHYAS
jgi:hypothetical protein